MNLLHSAGAAFISKNASREEFVYQNVMSLQRATTVSDEKFLYKHLTEINAALHTLCTKDPCSMWYILGTIIIKQIASTETLLF